MPLPKQYSALLRSMKNPSSRLETFEQENQDPFTDATANKFKGYTYAQLCELRLRDRAFYDELFNDSAFD